MIKLLFLIISLSAFAGKKIMPSVQDIDAKNKNKFDVAVYKCIANNDLLKKVYMSDTVKIAIQSKHKTATNCPEIVSSLQKVLTLQQKMQELVNMPECANGIEQQEITLEAVRQTQENISSRYNEIAQAYTQYFAYDTNLINVESCMQFYEEFTIAHKLNMAQEMKVRELKQAQRIAKKNRLRGPYGNQNGAKSLDATIAEINNNEIRMLEISQYAILESEINKWELAGAFNKKLVYKSSQNNYIAFPMQKGVSYSADSLPYSLFQIQKKVDIKKNGYSIFFVKPLI